MGTLVLAAALMICVGGLLAVQILTDKPRVILVVVLPGSGYDRPGKAYSRPGRSMLRLEAG